VSSKLLRVVPFLPIIESEAGDAGNFVKKAVNWALRQIGKRNPHLNALAIETAGRIEQQDSKAARWVVPDALRELTSEAAQARLKAKAL
jgi:3-methyladenine DNA glycosylase AlkD